MPWRLRDSPAENWAQMKLGLGQVGSQHGHGCTGWEHIGARNEALRVKSWLIPHLSSMGTPHSWERQAGTPVSPRKHLGEAPAELKSLRRTLG